MGMDEPTTNKAYPDASALYWGARFRLPAGSTLRLDGRYPHARFMSINSYGLVDGVEHAAVDSLEDTQIKPDRGSVNPFRTGADRYTVRRDYRVSIPADDGARTSTSARNVLDVPDTNEGSVQELIYRVYLPDRARDQSVRSLPQPTLTLADGSVLSGSSMCAAVNDQQRFFTFQTMPEGAYRSLVNTPGADVRTNAAFDPVRWEKFFNTPLALSIYRLSTPLQDMRLADQAKGEVGGYYDNRAVKYLVGPINAAYGDVLVLHGKLPTTPRTGPHIGTVQSGQMRYWSICQNGSPVETNAIDCVTDDEARKVLRNGRTYTIVVSTRADRPANARHQCDVAWLDWGTQRDVLNRRSGTLVLRNLDSDPGFARSVQKIGPADTDVTSVPNPGHRRVMGDYLPTSRYMSTGQFERRGCSAGRSAGLG